MGYNKKALSKIKADLNSAKAPSKPRDIIVDPRGQWEHPGQPTRIPGNDITMQGVSYPVMAYPNVGQPQMMYPNQDYQFPGADYVDEYPQMKRGGSKKFTRDITATNILFTKNPYLKKRKKRKNRVYSPTAPYFQSGGYLPKAQKGLLNLRDAKVEVVPFSYNYSNPQGQTIWGKPYPQEPTYRVGIEAPIKKPKEGYHTLNLDVGLPYSGKLKPSTELRYDWYGKPTLGSENIQLPYVQMTGRGGYDPVEKGFAGMSARTYYGFGTARPQTKSRPAQFGKNDWWSTLGPAFDFNLGDMQTIKNSEFRGNGKRFILDPEWAYGVRGDIEYRPGKDKNFRIGSRYGIMFDPIEGKNMEMLGYKSNSDDGMQFSVNPQLEVYGNYNVDLEPNFKKRTSGKLTETAKTTGTTTQNKNTGNTVVIDGIPVEVQNTKENSEPCPEGYRRDRPGGKCVPIKEKTKGPCPPGYTRKYFWEECYREKAHHPRWLQEGGKLGPIPINSGRKVLRDWTYGESIGMLQEDDGGYIETELTPEEIQAYRDGGYIVEEITDPSIPTLTKAEDGVIVKKRKKKKQDTGINVETGQPAEISDAVEYRLPYENAPEGATEVLYQTYPVPVKEKAPDWAKFEKEYLNTKPIEDFLYDKKIQYLKRNKGLNQAYGQTLENFPSQVEQTFRDEYEYKMNNYITQRLGQKNKFKPSRRGEWVDELTDRERSIVANSKYESKLQPSVWSRTLSGARSAFNVLPGPDITTQIPGLTKKEDKEALTSWFTGVEALAPLEIPGTDIMNRVKNYNLSPNAQFKENPAIASGERRANVNDLDVMLPTLPLDIFGAAELIGNIPKGVKALKNFLKPTAATSEIIENIPASENVIETAFNSKSGKNVKTPASPDQILNKYDTYKDLGKKNSSLTQEEAEDFLANLPQENIDVIDEGKTWDARFPDAETTMSKQKEAFDFGTDVMERWAIRDPDKYYKNKEIIRTAEKERQNYTNNVFDKEHFNLHKKYAIEDGKYMMSVFNKSSDKDEIYKTIDGYIKDKASKDPDYARYQELENYKNKTLNDLDGYIQNLKKESQALIDPDFKQKVKNLYELAEVKQEGKASNFDSGLNTRIKDRSKLVYMKEDDPAFKSLSPESQDNLRKNWKNIRGVRTKDDTITLASTPEKTYKLVYEPVGDAPSVKDFRLQEFKTEVLNHPGQVGATQAHEVGHDLQNFYDRWIDLLQEYNPDYGYYTGKDTNPIAKLFKEHMVEPKKVEAGSTKRYDPDTWLSSVGELHSELAKPRAAMVKYIMETENVSMENAIRMLKNAERAGYDPLYKTYLETHDLNRHFKPNTPFEIKKQLLKFLPATVPAAIGTGMMQQEKDGGSVYLEVSSDDIDKYVQGGYVVEELD